jgi:hypothetical protein
MVMRWILSRWHGDAPLGTVFWRDMLFVGTLINVATTLAAIGLLAIDAPTVPAVLVYFAPIPWNLLLFFSVWRSASKAPGLVATSAQVAAAIWLIAATTL